MPGPIVVVPDSPPSGEVTADAELISPNADGRLDQMSLSADFTEPISWTFSIGGGSELRALAEPLFSLSGEGTAAALTWDGRTTEGSAAPDGRYVWKLEGRDAAGNEMTPLTGEVEVDRTAPVFTDLSAFPKKFDRSEDDVTGVEFRVSEAARVKAKIMRKGRTIRRLGKMEFRRAGNSQFLWNGRNRSGDRVRAGRYQVVLTGADEAFNRTTNRALVIRVVR